MKRIQFVIVGRHPLIPVTLRYLIDQGYALVPNMADVEPNSPVFALVGAEVFDAEASLNTLAQVRQIVAKDWPVLLLSSSSVYSDRNSKLGLLEVEPMDEAYGHVVTSPLDEASIRPLTSLMVEHLFLQRPVGKTTVIRPFNVYGPDVAHGVIASYVTAVKNDEPLIVHGSGRQIRTFLFSEDYVEAIGQLLTRMLSGHRGIYNIGSTEQIEVLSLAKSIGHAFGKEPNIEFADSPQRHVWWKLPAVDRIRVDCKWKYKTSLRSGLFLLARDK